MNSQHWHHDSRWRLLVAVACGVAVAGLAWFVLDPAYAPLLGWSTTSLVFCLFTWVPGCPGQHPGQPGWV